MGVQSQCFGHKAETLNESLDGVSISQGSAQLRNCHNFEMNAGSWRKPSTDLIKSDEPLIDNLFPSEHYFISKFSWSSERTAHLAEMNSLS